MFSLEHFISDIRHLAEPQTY